MFAEYCDIQDQDRDSSSGRDNSGVTFLPCVRSVTNCSDFNPQARRMVTTLPFSHSTHRR